NSAIDFILNAQPPPHIYPLSLHDALPIYRGDAPDPRPDRREPGSRPAGRGPPRARPALLGRLLEGDGARLAPRARLRRRARRDCGMVPREPRVVGADQVRRLPRVLPAPV